jgi:hypothetical protein
MIEFNTIGSSGEDYSSEKPIKIERNSSLSVMSTDSTHFFTALPPLYTATNKESSPIPRISSQSWSASVAPLMIQASCNAAEASDHAPTVFVLK